MLDAKVTSKGQITIPKAVRDSLGIRPGDEVEIVIEDGAFTCRRKPAGDVFGPWLGSWKAIAGFTGLTTDEIMEEMRGPYDLGD
jgi:AbrB family looped-hinge helix DNA binding protein